MSGFALEPWDWDASGKPDSNGDFNLYIVDANKRKIAAIWGKRNEKENTARLIAAAPDLLSLACQYRDDLRHGVPDAGSKARRLEAIDTVIAKVEGQS